ncbi:unnamed protein product, partial [Sphacelaria rigidula]
QSVVHKIQIYKMDKLLAPESTIPVRRVRSVDFTTGYYLLSPPQQVESVDLGRKTNPFTWKHFILSRLALSRQYGVEVDLWWALLPLLRSKNMLFGCRVVAQKKQLLNVQKLSLCGCRDQLRTITRGWLWPGNIFWKD